MREGWLDPKVQRNELKLGRNRHDFDRIMKHPLWHKRKVKFSAYCAAVL
jgi:hypothetical protein